MTFVEENVSSGIVFVGVFTATFLAVWLNRQNQRKSRYPPCLMSLPVFGSLPFVPDFTQLHVYFMKQSNKIGKVFSLYLGSEYTVVLNGRETIQAALVKQSLAFADRPFLYTQQFTDPDQNGFVMHRYNDKFKHFQKHSLAILKQFGFGQGIMERKIQVEVEELINQIRKLDGKAFDPNEPITMNVFNVISNIIFGKRFEISDPKLHDMVRMVHDSVRTEIDTVMAINFFPILRYIPKFKKALKIVLKNQDILIDEIKDRINKSLSGETDESFISCFVKEEGPDYNHQQLVMSLRDLFLGGTETTATTLQWMFVFMANHPEIQKRLQTEIDEVVQKSRLPSLDDKARLPYVEATILELMRIRTLIPLAVPHMTTSDVEVDGYFIPAKTMVLVNLYSAHMDPEVWKEPEKFVPERFLDESGAVINKDHMMSFSLGKRSCLGELLARQELFLFMTGLLQNFDILPTEGQDAIDATEHVGVTNAPLPFQVRVVARP